MSQRSGDPTLEETHDQGFVKTKEATMGFEPMIRVLQTLALASWPRRLERLHFIKE